MRQLTRADFKTLLLLYGVAYVYSLHFAPMLARHFPQSSWNQTHESCLKELDDSNGKLPYLRYLLGGRGGSYIIDEPHKSSTLDSCLLTFWGGSHGVLYFLIGLFVPRAFWLTFWIGAAFEIYEWCMFDCADPLDIAWNSIGFFLGRQSRQMLTKGATGSWRQRLLA